MAQAARIFVSYVHEDIAWCRAFVQALRDAGADVWYDEHDLGYGVIGAEIERELQARPIVIVILSPASLASSRVQRETSAAVALRDAAWPGSRTILLVVAEPADALGLWADFPHVSGPGDRGLSAAEAARRAIATLAIAPMPTIGEAPVSSRSEPARKVKNYRRGPRVLDHETRGLISILVLVAVSVGIFALLFYTSTPVTRSLFQNVPNDLDPLVGSAPQGITTGPDGALWFTESQGNQIGRITTSGQLREVPLPTGSAPQGITTGPDGALWFTESGGNRIGRITIGGQVREFLANGAPDGITTGPDGALWFTESNGNAIGRITISGQMHEFPLPIVGSAPQGITTGPDGALWFTESQGNQIGRITISGQLRGFPVRGAPMRITTGPDGALWFTEYSGQIGRITTNGHVREFSLPPGVTYPQGITRGSDGALWFTEFEGNQIGRITTSGEVSEVYIHAPPNWPTNALPWGITTGPDGALWFTEYYGNAIGRITTGGQLRDFSLPFGNGTPTSSPEGTMPGRTGPPTG